MTEFKRDILKGENLKVTTEHLQKCLVDLIDLALQGKQAHWNVVGKNFRSVHLQLDEIIAAVRDAADEVAERISTLGISPNGNASVVSSDSPLKTYPEGFQKVPDTVSLYADRLKTTVDTLREAIAATDEPDPITNDMLIGISTTVEKYLWMMQTQEM